MELRDVVSKDYERVDVSTKLSTVLGVIQRKHPEVLVVFDGPRYRGILTNRWLVRSKILPDTKVGSILRSVPCLDVGTPVAEAVRQMIESGVNQLPVFEGEKLVGIVKGWEILRRVVGGRYGDEGVEKLVSRDVISATGETPLGKAINLLRENGVTKLPIIEGGKLLGILTIHDIVEVVVHRKHRETVGDLAGVRPSSPLGLPVKSLMSSPVVTLPVSARVRDAFREMDRHDISCVVVDLGGGEYGILTRTDLLRGLLRVEQPSYRVQVSGATMDKHKIFDGLRSVVSRFENLLGDIYAHIYFHEHREVFRGEKLTLCKVRLYTSRGFFAGKGESWGQEGALHVALDHLERQLLTAKELAHEQRVAGEILSGAWLD
ncbi:MAG: hypothetical protein DRO11_00675 [Methanobacteriota archaeon]|nr:MAG: hypothetical protein DRO11_00675 [Euryarchaeota archaeon]